MPIRGCELYLAVVNVAVDILERRKRIDVLRGLTVPPSRGYRRGMVDACFSWCRADLAANVVQAVVAVGLLGGQVDKEVNSGVVCIACGGSLLSDCMPIPLVTSSPSLQ